MTNSLSRATYEVLEADLEAMVLERHQLPPAFHDFVPLRSGFLDNELLARQGFPSALPESYEEIGRISGYLEEFGSAAASSEIGEGTDLAIATVAHLFQSEADVRHWMYEIFVKQFEAHVGKPAGEGLKLEGVCRLSVSGFADEAVALQALQRGPLGLVSSTVVDFRMGRLLGVSYVAALGDCERLDDAVQAGRELERQMVRVALSV